MFTVWFYNEHRYGMMIRTKDDDDERTHIQSTQPVYSFNSQNKN